jgi:hypothetical protein
MAFTVIQEQQVENICIRLVEQNVASFAITFCDDGNLAAIAHRTSDYVCARRLFAQSIEVVGNLGLLHPAWRKPAARDVPINIGEQP